jgi:hypothetical protein
VRKCRKKGGNVGKEEMREKETTWKERKLRKRKEMRESAGKGRNVEKEEMS